MSYKEIITVDAAFAASKDNIDLAKTKESLSHLPGKFIRGMIALLTLQVIIGVVNNDNTTVTEWKADYNDTNQRKWFPWYKGGAADPSGSGFSFDDTGYEWTLTRSTGGARLALKDEARAKHMNKYFSELYKELYLILE